MCKKLVSGVVALFVAVLAIAPFYTRAEGIDYSYGLFDPQTETLYYPDEYSVSNYGYIFNVFDVSLKIWIGRDVNVLNDVPHYETIDEGIYFLQIILSNINLNINPSGKYYIFSSSRIYRLYKLKSDIFEWVEVSSYIAGVSSENAYFGFSTTNFQDFNNLIYSPRDILWNGSSDIAIDANPTETNPHSNNIQQLPKITLNTQVEFVNYLQAMMMLAAGTLAPMAGYIPSFQCADCSGTFSIDDRKIVEDIFYCRDCADIRFPKGGGGNDREDDDHHGGMGRDRETGELIGRDGKVHEQCWLCKKFFSLDNLTSGIYEYSVAHSLGLTADVLTAGITLNPSHTVKVTHCKPCGNIIKIFSKNLITPEEATEMAVSGSIGYDASNPIFNPSFSNNPSFNPVNNNTPQFNPNFNNNPQFNPVNNVNVTVDSGGAVGMPLEFGGGGLLDFSAISPADAKELLEQSSETFDFFRVVFGVIPAPIWQLFIFGLSALIVVAITRRFLW